MGITEIHKKINMNTEKEKDYYYRKIVPVLNGASLVITLPKQYTINLGLTKDDYVKVRRKDDKIIVEKA